MKQHQELSLFAYTIAISLFGTWMQVQFFDVGHVKAWIYTHAALGGLAFFIGGIAMAAKKGGLLHRQSGLIFYVTMVVSVFISWIVSILPGHLSPTMFHIAVLSLYFLIGGKRSLGFKHADHDLKLDKLLTWGIILTSIGVMAYTLVVHGQWHPLRTVFGFLGLGFGLVDLWVYRKAGLRQRRWLILHLSKMLGGYAAAVTAFFVAQNVLSGYFNWFTPGAVALLVIPYWMHKTKVIKFP